MQEQIIGQFKLDAVPKLEFIYEQASVVAEVEQELQDPNGKYYTVDTERTILQSCSGRFEPNTMTAILGPSGSGKTTLLNLLSGRLLSKNLTVRGRVRINGKQVKNMADYKAYVGYVMQQDVLLSTFTPTETFKFVTDLRLPHKSEEEKNLIVSKMIESLGLVKCANTYVGSNLIRGISGGEKKRTSIGTELLINPSLIFLDEPTTGLDSTTALHVMRFLNRLAGEGRTIVTTIHQPSSQIFHQFDKILLILDGHVVYHNKSAISMSYFSKMGMNVPVHSNPMDYYMKIMNKQGISLKYLEDGKTISDEQVNRQFEQRVALLVDAYKSQAAEPVCAENGELELKNDGSAPWCTQMFHIFRRNAINQFRNPLGLLAKVIQTIFFAIIGIILYEKPADSFSNYIQNTRGMLSFLTLNLAFPAIFGALNVFNSERAVFIRERLSNTYETSSFFVGLSLAYFPLNIILPGLYLTISYFVVNLDNDADNFFLTFTVAFLCFWMSSAYGLFISTLFADAEVALSLVPLFIIPLLLLGGFFAPLQNVHDFFRVFEYISMFKYGYQGMIQSQFFDDTDGINYNGQFFSGNILGENGTFYFEEPLWLSLLLMAVIGFVVNIFAFISLYIISNPKSLRLLPPEDKATPRKNNQSNNSTSKINGNTKGVGIKL